MKSPVVKRSIVIAGHKTSVSLEDAFWKCLKEIAGNRDMTLSDLVASIDTERHAGNLVVGDPPVRARSLSRAAQRPARRHRARQTACVRRQFCGPTDASGRTLRRAPGAGLISTGAGSAGAISLFGGGAGG